MKNITTSELLALGEHADQSELPLPDELVISDELAVRQERLTHLDRAKAVLEARAQERYLAAPADYEAKVREREEKARTTGCKPGGRPPHPPTRTTEHGSVQLHRPRVAHHEKRHERGL